MVCREDTSARLVEFDAVGADRLGWREDRTVGSLDKCSGERQGASLEVDVRPAKGKKLAAAGARGGRKTEESSKCRSRFPRVDVAFGPSADI